jgi:hypothetical protein
MLFNGQFKFIGCWPTQGVLLVAVGIGKGFTVMLVVAVFTQPAASVPVTVYVVVPAGVPVTGLPDEGFKPVVGFQAYATAPVAVRVAVCWPAQIVAVFTATGGKGFTVMAVVAVFTQPFPSVPVTV